MSTKNAAHTPGPLHSGSVYCPSGFGLFTESGKLMLRVSNLGSETSEPEREFAEYVVRAVNSHAELLAALKAIARSESFAGGTWPGELQGIAKKAIGRAEGRA